MVWKPTLYLYQRYVWNNLWMPVSFVCVIESLPVCICEWLSKQQSECGTLKLRIDLVIL